MIKKMKFDYHVIASSTCYNTILFVFDFSPDKFRIFLITTTTLIILSLKHSSDILIISCTIHPGFVTIILPFSSLVV